MKIIIWVVVVVVMLIGFILLWSDAVRLKRELTSPVHIPDSQLQIEFQRGSTTCTINGLFITPTNITFMLTSNSQFHSTNGCVSSYSDGGIGSFTIQWDDIYKLTLHKLNTLR